jgi:Isochorismatase family
VRATIPLLDFFRRRKLPVFFTRIDGSDCGVWCEKAPRLRDLIERAPASQIVDEVAPHPGELVIRKTSLGVGDLVAEEHAESQLLRRSFTKRSGSISGSRSPS